MKKNDRPLPNEKLDSVADKVGGAGFDGLGKRSKITRAERKPQPQPEFKSDEIARQFARSLSTNLTSGGMPTLADRVRKEGVAAYGGKFKGVKKSKKRRK